MKRSARSLLIPILVAALAFSPGTAAAGDSNIVQAVNQVDGAAVVEASVQYRIAANGVVDQENGAYAAASCVDCQTLAAAFQLVLVTREVRELVPRNEAFAANVVCAECLTWASAQQIVIATGGPATLTGEGHIRLRVLEDRLKALKSSLPTLTLEGVKAELDAAFGELLNIARQEVRRIDGGLEEAEVVATRVS